MFGHARRRSGSKDNITIKPGPWNVFHTETPQKRNRSESINLEKAYRRSSMSGANMNNSARARYLKLAGALALIFTVLYVFTPGGKIEEVSSNITQHIPNHIPGTSSLSSGRVASDPTTGTDKCQRSSSKDKPIVQYALMVDAGSTGSRIHVYRFNNCGDTPELEKEDFKMIKGGLSDYKDDPEGAAKSLDILMQVALDNVPVKLQPCSPVAVKATAGLRLLGEGPSKKILDAVRTRLENKYPFPVVEGNGVSIMDGKDEGVYAWITTNYLLGKIGGPDHSPTAAIFDLGGGSTQIVFEPTFPKLIGGGMPSVLAPGDHHYDLTFGGRSFDLYQHSHLGYGLKEARKAIHKAVLHAKFGNDPVDTSKPVMNPCIPPGMTQEVEIDMRGDGQKTIVNMTGPAMPSATLCRTFAESILFKDKECNLAPCSFNGVHQPSLAKTFSREDVYIFSYFYDRTQPLGMPSSFTLEELKDITAKVCGGEETWGAFGTIKGALDELRGRPQHCLDLNFQFALLHTGYEMPLQREVKIAKKIKGNELGWCLGASLPLLSTQSGWKCKVVEVHQ